MLGVSTTSALSKCKGQMLCWWKASGFSGAAWIQASRSPLLFCPGGTVLWKEGEQGLESSAFISSYCNATRYCGVIVGAEDPVFAVFASCGLNWAPIRNCSSLGEIPESSSHFGCTQQKCHLCTPRSSRAVNQRAGGEMTGGSASEVCYWSDLLVQTQPRRSHTQQISRNVQKMNYTGSLLLKYAACSPDGDKYDTLLPDFRAPHPPWHVPWHK